MLLFCHFAFLSELDINKYLFDTSSNYNQISSYCFLLPEAKFTVFETLKGCLSRISQYIND